MPNEEINFDNLNDEIALDENGDFIVPGEVLMKILNYYEDIIKKLLDKLPEENPYKVNLLNLRSNYCCIKYQWPTDIIEDYHPYCEDLKEVAILKCKSRLDGVIKNGHCCHYVDDLECDDC